MADPQVERADEPVDRHGTRVGRVVQPRRDHLEGRDAPAAGARHARGCAAAPASGGTGIRRPKSPSATSRDEDYFAHYREVLADCVKRAARTHLPLACEVSGGLDSTAVYCMAEKLRRDGELPAPALKGYTYIFEPGCDADEIEYARAVARHTGTDIREIEPFLPDLEWFAARGLSDCDVPPFPNGAMAVNIGKAAIADGCRVLLNGEGGNEFLTGKPIYYAEQLAQRDWRGCGAACATTCAHAGPRETAWRLARFGLAPLAPEPVKDFWRRLTRSRTQTGRSRLYWLPAELEALRIQRRGAAQPLGSAAHAQPAPAREAHGGILRLRRNHPRSHGAPVRQGRLSGAQPDVRPQVHRIRARHARTPACARRAGQVHARQGARRPASARSRPP